MTHRRTEPSGGRPKKRLSPLWWALPGAFLVAILLLIVAGFMMCGVSGCSGGGFGVSDYGRGAVIPLLAVGGLVLALPLVFIHWCSDLAVRLTVGLGVAAIWTLVHGVRLYAQVA